VKAGRPFVKIASGTIADSQTTTIDGKAVTIFADPGAKLSTTTPGVILRVQSNNADVRIFDLEITGATGAGNAAISIPNGGNPRLTLTSVRIDGNQGVGLSAAGGIVVLSRCAVTANAGGGVAISGAQFDITNSVIALNGGSSSLFGGVDISQTPNTAGIYRLDFTTITANLGQPTIPVNTGINCSSIGKMLVFDSNIVYGNAVNGGGQQVGGSALCSMSYSDVGPDPTTGTNNINMPPMFANAAQGDFHLANASPAKDAANPAATLDVDIDGDSRPQGARRDMGADEVRL
jgi:hypothetical protein